MLKSNALKMHNQVLNVVLLIVVSAFSNRDAAALRLRTMPRRNTELLRKLDGPTDGSRFRRTGKLGTLLTCLLLFSILRNNYSFMPDGGYPYTHQKITEDAVRAAYTNSELRIEESVSTRRALATIVQANKDVDSVWVGGVYGPAKNHFDDEQFGPGNDRLLRLKGEIQKNLRVGELDMARKNLGAALHTLQDFYAHSNWPETHEGVCHELGTLAFPIWQIAGTGEGCISCDLDALGVPFDCYQRFTTVALTSGYFMAIFKPIGKCSHGGGADFSVYSDAEGPGINKDTPDSPHGGAKVHEKAGSLAVLSTTEFLLSLKNENWITVDDLKKLLGQEAIVFRNQSACCSHDFEVSIDGTFSKRFSIESREALDVALPKDLERVEPGVVHNLTVTLKDPCCGGADYSLEVPSYIELVSVKGEYLLTDSVPDEVLFGKRSHSAYMFRFFSAVHIKNVYRFRIREQDDRLVTPAAIISSTPLHASAAEGSSGSVNILSLTSDALTNQLDLPVDGTLREITVWNNGAGHLTIIKPNGAILQEDEAGVSISEDSDIKITRIIEPIPGNWLLKVSGETSFRLDVTGQSSVGPLGAQFVELLGRPGHTGHFPIPGEPLSLQTNHMQAQLAGQFDKVAFEFRDQVNRRVKNIELASDNGSGEFLGDVETPGEPFLLYVTGKDANGLEFQRVYPRIFRPAALRIKETGNPVLLPGMETEIQFNITNTGAGGVFEMFASDTGGFITNTTPANFTLPQGASTSITVRARVPTNQLPGIATTITCTVRSSDGISMNSCKLLAGVVSIDPDGPLGETIAAPPAILSEQKDVLVFDGTSAILSADVVGTNLRYRWGYGLLGSFGDYDTNSTLAFSSVPLEYIDAGGQFHGTVSPHLSLEGPYFFEVSNDFGKVESHFLFIVVSDKLPTLRTERTSVNSFDISFAPTGITEADFMGSNVSVRNISALQYYTTSFPIEFSIDLQTWETFETLSGNSKLPISVSADSHLFFRVGLPDEVALAPRSLGGKGFTMSVNGRARDFIFSSQDSSFVEFLVGTTNVIHSGTYSYRKRTSNESELLLQSDDVTLKAVTVLLDFDRKYRGDWPEGKVQILIDNSTAEIGRFTNFRTVADPPVYRFGPVANIGVTLFADGLLFVSEKMVRETLWFSDEGDSAQTKSLGPCHYGFTFAPEAFTAGLVPSWPVAAVLRLNFNVKANEVNMTFLDAHHGIWEGILNQSPGGQTENGTFQSFERTPDRESCTTYLKKSPDPERFPSAGGERVLAIEASLPDCGWLLRPSVDWITLAITTGSGNATVNYTVLPNTFSFSRSAAISLGDEFISVQQDAGAGANSLAGRFLVLSYQFGAERFEFVDDSSVVYEGGSPGTYSYDATTRRISIRLSNGDMYEVELKGSAEATTGEATVIYRSPLNGGQPVSDEAHYSLGQNQ
jgi:hypothetical protein